MRGFTAALASLILASDLAAAQDSRPDYDFYVLSLSWSPSFCEMEGRTGDAQCSGLRPYSFVVHGLWPQRERGWPEFCPAERRSVPPSLAGAMLDLMPSRGLIDHQWVKHGSCTGLSQESYFARTRAARERIAIPPEFQAPMQALRVAPRDVSRAFQAVNPGLDESMMAVTCAGQRLREVRICMTADLAFRPCPEVAHRSCSRRDLVVPPVR